jgi:putative DNA primase/helicase
MQTIEGLGDFSSDGKKLSEIIDKQGADGEKLDILHIVKAAHEGGVNPDYLNRCVDFAADELEPLIIDPADPCTNAEIFIKRQHSTETIRTLQFWQGNFFSWTGAAYSQMPADDIRAALYDFLKKSLIDGKKGIAPFRPNRHRVADLSDALKATANLSCEYTPPCWLKYTTKPDAVELIAMSNGLLHLPSQTLHKADPAFFTTSSLPFNYEKDSAQPAEWLRFLETIWPDDPEAISSLQEIFGLLLTSDTTQQKIFLVVGPLRSGKGTIARVLTAMLGQQNVAGPTLASLSQSFGLAPLIGKNLAVIADARLGIKGRSTRHYRAPIIH